MKHRIRINGEVKELDCELGSGIFDKNGREIFEGDKVLFNDYTFYVKLDDGGFCFINKFNFKYPLGKAFSPDLEIVNDKD